MNANKARIEKIEASKEPIQDDEINIEALALSACLPKVQSAVTNSAILQSCRGLGFTDLLVELTKSVNAADLDPAIDVEEMLGEQARILNLLFHAITVRATGFINRDIEYLEKYLKLALRCQSQCRATLDSLSDTHKTSIRNYVGQANIAHGNQQVNNHAAVTEKPSADIQAHGEFLNNKVMDAPHE